MASLVPSGARSTGVNHAAGCSDLPKLRLRTQIAGGGKSSARASLDDREYRHARRGRRGNSGTVGRGFRAAAEDSAPGQLHELYGGTIRSEPEIGVDRDPPGDRGA